MAARLSASHAGHPIPQKWKSQNNMTFNIKQIIDNRGVLRKQMGNQTFFLQNFEMLHRVMCIIHKKTNL
jgi:hypothetical protein